MGQGIGAPSVWRSSGQRDRPRRGAGIEQPQQQGAGGFGRRRGTAANVEHRRDPAARTCAQPAHPQRGGLGRRRSGLEIVLLDPLSSPERSASLAGACDPQFASRRGSISMRPSAWNQQRASPARHRAASPSHATEPSRDSPARRGARRDRYRNGDGDQSAASATEIRSWPKLRSCSPLAPRHQRVIERGNRRNKSLRIQSRESARDSQ